MPRALTVFGELDANRVSDVAANTTGVVVRRFVERGDRVEAGAPLAQLDRRSAALGAASARAAMENARVQLELARAACARSDRLRQHNAISQQEWERADGQCKLSSGTAAAARANARLAAQAVADATVRAPFSGRIAEAHVDAGEYVQPATPVVTLIGLEPLRLRFAVGQAETHLVHVGQELEFSVPAIPNLRFSATVARVDPILRAATRDLIVEAVVDPTEPRLRPGMFATIEVPLPEESSVAVPVAAVRRTRSGARLFAVVRGVVEERVVQLGSEKDGYVVVLDGVEPGDRVVLAAAGAIEDGVLVK